MTILHVRCVVVRPFVMDRAMSVQTVVKRLDVADEV